jgi:hypothetical protein
MMSAVARTEGFENVAFILPWRGRIDARGARGEVG